MGAGTYGQLRFGHVGRAETRTGVRVTSKTPAPLLGTEAPIEGERARTTELFSLGCSKYIVAWKGEEREQ